MPHQDPHVDRAQFESSAWDFLHNPYLGAVSIVVFYLALATTYVLVALIPFVGFRPVGVCGACSIGYYLILRRVSRLWGVW